MIYQGYVGRAYDLQFSELTPQPPPTIVDRPPQAEDYTELKTSQLSYSSTVVLSHLQGNIPRSTQPTSDDEDTQNSPISFLADPAEDEPESQTQTLVLPQNTRDEAMPPQTFAVPQKRIAKVNNASSIQKLMKLEEEKLKIFKERNLASRSSEDPDYHFLMSLLLYLRKVPEERKMFVRTKLQQVFCEEEERCRAQNTPQPIHHGARTFSSYTSSASDSWASGSQVGTPLSVPEHEDLASYFSAVTPDH
ncbi:hypothetical protein GE061_007753 [Apolygus lucorum]|uniref:Uncharacterized protein n=1 Tax=Apolygus lucorum TaxID=248454 RepID=A0A6A4JME2_APOLU|nr:hypothetical protein GE061_007753 [Apolygus lucorum]